MDKTLSLILVLFVIFGIVIFFCCKTFIPQKEVTVKVIKETVPEQPRTKQQQEQNQNKKYIPPIMQKAGTFSLVRRPSLYGASSPIPPPIPFYSKAKSPNVYSPNWTRVGILTSAAGTNLHLYRRSPFPAVKDCYEYAAEDKDKFFVTLPKSISHLKTGDTVDTIVGQTGPFTVHIMYEDYDYFVY